MKHRARRTVIVCGRPEIRTLAASTARQIGFQVVEEATLESVVDRISDDSVAVILEGEQLSRLAGYGLFTALRKHDIPLIVLKSRELHLATVLENKSLRVHEFDVPIQWSELADTLRRCGRRRPHSGAARSKVGDSPMQVAVEMLRQAVGHCSRLAGMTEMGRVGRYNGRRRPALHALQQRSERKGADPARGEMTRCIRHEQGRDINEVLLRLEPLLTRQMCGDGHIVFDLSPSLLPVRAAEEKLAELIMCLAAWARDVVSAEYQWTLSTRAATLRELGDIPVPVLGKGCYVMLRLAGEFATNGVAVCQQSDCEYQLSILSPANTFRVARTVTECGGYLHIEHEYHRRIELMVLFEHGGDGL